MGRIGWTSRRRVRAEDRQRRRASRDPLMCGYARVVGALASPGKYQRRGSPPAPGAGRNRPRLPRAADASNDCSRVRLAGELARAAKIRRSPGDQARRRRGSRRTTPILAVSGVASAVVALFVVEAFAELPMDLDYDAVGGLSAEDGRIRRSFDRRTLAAAQRIAPRPRRVGRVVSGSSRRKN